MEINANIIGLPIFCDKILNTLTAKVKENWSILQKNYETIS